MSTLYYDSTVNQIKFDMENSFSKYSRSSSAGMQYTCTGQDAFYILRKRALLLDLWNLLPETICTENEKNNFYDLPVIMDNSKDFAFNNMDVAIPLQ